MIYELKIELIDVGRPVWRRLRVDGEMTFFDLHEILQTAFDWEDMHLHSFTVLKSNGKKTRTVINSVDDIGTAEDEEMELVGSWLPKKGDQAMYVYDFGDDWRHMITVEKVLKAYTGDDVPYCLEARNIAPDEDSRGDILMGNDVSPNVPNDEIAANLNEQFAVWDEMDDDFFDEEEYDFEDIDEDEMHELFNEFLDTMTGDIQKESVFQELYLTVKEFYKRAPWNDLEPDQVFYVDFGVGGMFGSVMGSSGVEFGLSVYDGPEGWVAMNELMTGQMDQQHFIFKNNGMGLMFCDREELPIEYYRQIKETNVSFRGRGQWPLMSSYLPGHVPLPLDTPSAMVLKDMLEFAIEAADLVKSGGIVPYPFETGQFLCFVPNQETGEFEPLYGEYEMLEKVEFLDEDGPEIFELINDLELNKLMKMPKVTNEYEVQLQYPNDAIQDNDGERPYLPIIGLIKEYPSEMIVHHTIHSHIMPEQALIQTLIELTEQLQALPVKLRLPAQLESAVAGVMKEIGVEVRWK